MPIDPSIPLGVRPQPFNNPFQALIAMREGEQQRTQQAREDQQRATQQRQAQQRIDQDQQRIDSAEKKEFTAKQIHDAAENAYQKIKDGNAEEVLGLLQPEARVLAESWLGDIAQAKQRRDAEGVALGKRTAQFIQANNYDPVTSATSLKLLSDVHPGAKDALEHVTDPAAFKKLIDHFATLGDKPEADFTLSEGQTRFDPTGKPIAAVAKPPGEPKTLDGLIAAARNNPTELNRLLAIKRQEAEATRAPVQPPAPGPLETIIGPNGKPIRVPREQAIGKETVAGQEKPSSGVQKRVLNFFNRARQADEELEGLESQIEHASLPGQTWMKYAPNFLQTQTGQSYTAAQRAFTEARLRKDSGAAIPEQEFKNDRQTFFAQPGDSKETLEQKRRARASILAALAFESGQALGEDLGNPDEAKTVIQQYKDRATKPKAGGGIKILKIEQVGP